MFSLIKTIPKIWTKDKVQITIWTISSFLIASSWYAEPELPLFQDATQATVARMVRVLLTSSIFLLGLSASLSRTIYTIKKEQDPKPTPINKLSISKESISLLKILAENEPARVCPSEILTETMQYSRVKQSYTHGKQAQRLFNPRFQVNFNFCLCINLVGNSACFQ